MPEPIIIYGFKDKSGEFIDVSFPEIEEDKARLYANENELLLVKSVYEWQEDIDVADERTPDESLLKPIPSPGTRVRLGNIDRFDAIYIPEGEFAVIREVDRKNHRVTLLCETYHPELDEWSNEIYMSLDPIQNWYPSITDPEQRLRMAFWSEVEEAIGLSPQQNDALSSICQETKHALRLGLPVEVIKGQIDLANDELDRSK